MGTLTVIEFMTLDGVAQAPGGPEEDAEKGFEHGGWQAPFADAEAGDVMLEQARTLDALLLGRRTYDIFAGYWPTASTQNPFTGLLNNLPKYVASRSLNDPLDWQHSQVLDGDVASAVTAVKAQHHSVGVMGSLDLLQTLLAAQLVDRMILWQYPVVLGTGKRVFGSGATPTSMRLVQSSTRPNGALHLEYEPAGTPEYGVMGAVDPD